MQLRRSFSWSLLTVALTLSCGLTEETPAAGPSGVEDSPDDLPTESRGLINETCEPVPKLDCSIADVLDPEVRKQIAQGRGSETLEQYLWDDYQVSSGSYTLELDDVSSLAGLSCLSLAPQLTLAGGGPVDFVWLKEWTQSHAMSRLHLSDGFDLAGSNFNCLAGGRWPAYLFLEELALNQLPDLNELGQVKILVITQDETLSLDGALPASLASLIVRNADLEDVVAVTRASALNSLALINVGLDEHLDLFPLSLSNIRLDDSTLAGFPVVGPPKEPCGEFSALRVNLPEAELEVALPSLCDLGWVAAASNGDTDEIACTPPECQ